MSSSRLRDERGFSLPEVLIVIVLIGIVAAFAVPSFSGQRAESSEAQAIEQVRLLSRGLESCFVDEQDYRRCDDVASLRRYAGGQVAQRTVSGSPVVGVVGSDDTFVSRIVSVNQYTYQVAATAPTGTEFRIARSAAQPAAQLTCTHQGDSPSLCRGGSWDQ